MAFRGEKMKKKFMQMDWTETLVLLIVDIFIFNIFIFWAVVNIFSATGVAVSLVFFIFNLQNLAFLFGVALFSNLIISAIWHYLVKK